MRFIVDTQLPPKRSTYLKDLGYDSVHTTDFREGHLLVYYVLCMAHLERLILLYQHISTDIQFF